MEHCLSTPDASTQPQRGHLEDHTSAGPASTRPVACSREGEEHPGLVHFRRITISKSWTMMVSHVAGTHFPVLNPCCAFSYPSHRLGCGPRYGSATRADNAGRHWHRPRWCLRPQAAVRWSAPGLAPAGCPPLRGALGIGTEGSVHTYFRITQLSMASER